MTTSKESRRESIPVLESNLTLGTIRFEESTLLKSTPHPYYTTKQQKADDTGNGSFLMFLQS